MDVGGSFVCVCTVSISSFVYLRGDSAAPWVMSGYMWKRFTCQHRTIHDNVYSCVLCSSVYIVGISALAKCKKKKANRLGFCRRFIAYLINSVRSLSIRWYVFENSCCFFKRRDESIFLCVHTTDKCGSQCECCSWS